MNKLKKNTGITLIALVISIIVMLILAGVSLNATLGENGIVTRAQQANVAQKIAKYKEEMEINLTEAISAEEISGRDKIMALNEGVRKYIPSLEDVDVGKYGIIGGELYYLGNDEIELRAVETLGVTSGKVSDVEKNVLDSFLQSGEVFKQTNEEGEEVEVGEKLYDKNFQNGDKWKIINEVNNNEVVATYGTNWYYIKAGTEIEGIGKLANDFIINYIDRKLVKYDENIHTMLQFGANIAVKDDIVLNIDPVNMNGNTAESWGDVTLNGFKLEGEKDESGEIKSGWYGTGIRLDGVDDEIVFSGGADFSKGFTLSYYGKMIGDVNITKQTQDVLTSCRFSINTRTFSFNVSKNTASSSWSTAPVNDKGNNNGNLSYQWKDSEKINNNEDFYVDLIFNPEESKFSIYKNGVFCESTTVDPTYWDGGNVVAPIGGRQAFENLEVPFRIGARFGGAEGIWSFGKMDFYTIRLYKRALTEKELKDNYNATVSYHDILLNGGNAGTGGDTGGDYF